MKNQDFGIDKDREALIFASLQEQMNLVQTSSDETLFFDMKFYHYQRLFGRLSYRYYFYMYENFQYSYDMSHHIRRYLDFIEPERAYSSSILQEMQSIKRDLVKDGIYQEFDPELYSKKLVYSVNQMPVPRFVSGKPVEIALANASDTDCVLVMVKQRVDGCRAVYDRITELLDSGVNINLIKVVNADAKDEYHLGKYLDDSKIPYATDRKKSLLEFPEITKFINELKKEGFQSTREKCLSEMSKDLKDALIRVLNQYLDRDLDRYPGMLIELIQRSYLAPKRYVDCIQFIQFHDLVPNDQDHYLIMNYSDLGLIQVQKRFPLLNQEEIEKIGYFSLDQVNSYEKGKVERTLNSIQNLTLFFSLHTDTDNMLPDLDLSHPIQQQSYQRQVSEISHLHTLNRLDYAKARYDFDRYYLMNPNYDLYHNTYANDTDVFHHDFTGIYDSDLKYLLSEHPTITGAKLESYMKCRFQFLLKHLLKLDSYESTTNQFLGTLTHKVFEMATKRGMFDYQRIVEQSFEFPEEVRYKERLFRQALKLELEKLLPMFVDFHEKTRFTEIKTEWEFDIAYDSFQLKGVIDKLLIYKTEDNSVFYVIVDYKMNEKDLKDADITSRESLQLPFYLFAYYIELEMQGQKNIFPAGMFYQQTSIGRYSKERVSIEKQFQLKGIALNSVPVLEALDPDLSHLSGIRVKNDGDLAQSNRLHNNVYMKGIVSGMMNLLDHVIAGMKKAMFDINPKASYGKRKDSVSCEYCSFNSICFNKNKGLGGDVE